MSQSIGDAPHPSISRWYQSGAVVTDLMLAGLVIIAAVGLTDDRPWTAILCAAVLTVAVVARAWTRIALARVTYRLVPSRRRLVAGDAFELTLSVENRKSLPIPWLHVSEIVPPGLSVVVGDFSTQGRTFSGGRAINETVGIAAHGRVNLRIRLRAERRGLYTFGPALLQSGDIFGFYQAQREVRRQATDLVVFPKPLALPEFDLPAARPIGDALSRTPLAEDVTRPNGVREYRPGDPAGRIDWKASAKWRTLFVRNFDPSVTQNVALLVECETHNAESWSLDPDMLEAVIGVATTVVIRSLKQGFRVGIAINGIPFSDRYPPVVTPGAGKDRLATLMGCLAAAGTITTQPLETLIERYGPAALPFGTTIVYVSGVFPASTLAFLQQRVRHGHRVLALYAGRKTPPVLPGLPVIDLRAMLRAEDDSDA